MSGTLQLPTTGTLTGVALVTGINTALAEMVIDFRSATAPTAAGLGVSSLAGIKWRDSSAAPEVLKVRNQADDAWIIAGYYDEVTDVFYPASALRASNNLSDLASASTARTNLGVPLGTSGAVLGLLSTSNTYGAPQTPNVQALTDASTVTVAITAQVWTLTTAAARTIGAPSGGVSNTSYRLVLTSGGYTPAWNSVFKFPGGAVPSSLTGTCIFDFHYDGTKFNCVGQSVGEA